MTSRHVVGYSQTLIIMFVIFFRHLLFCMCGDLLDSCVFVMYWLTCAATFFASSGTDPATDLRATGFLSLMHLLHLVSSPDLLPLAHNVYKLSNDEDQVISRM